MPDGTASRAALLALRRERRVIEEGHRFLDERRVALAHELLLRARAHQREAAAFGAQHERARAALGDAVGVHGLEGVQAYPAAAVRSAAVRHQATAFLGLHLVDGAVLELAAAPGGAPVLRTAEAERCAQAFRALAARAAVLAGEVASLLRLADEYRRTERRVRALENIVLPESRAAERRLEAALEELDQEEVMRARRFAADPAGF